LPGDLSAVPVSGQNYNLFGAGPGDMADPVMLLDGSAVERSDIQFNPDSYHFFLKSTGADITSALSQKVKRDLVPNFDVSVDDDRMYRETTVAKGYKDPGPPSTDTGLGFILGSTLTQSVKQVGTELTIPNLKTDLKNVVFFAVIGLAIFYGIQNR
jgi:hypothetical protein